MDNVLPQKHEMDLSILQKLSLFTLRIALGWLMFYAGITKLLNPDWSAAGYIGAAKTFPGFYGFLASPDMVSIVSFVNEWALTLLGVALILGICVRWASVLGAVMMLMYYLPVLSFPYVGDHSFLVDEHIIYALVLVLFADMRAGRVWGIENILGKMALFRIRALKAIIE